MEKTKFVLLGLLLALVPVTLAGHSGPGPEGKLGEIEHVVRLAYLAHRGAGDADAAVIVAALGVFDLGKKGKIVDAPERLTRMLEQVKDPALRNAVRLLSAAGWAEKNDPRAAADALEAIVTENAPLMDGRLPELRPAHPIDAPPPPKAPREEAQ